METVIQELAEKWAPGRSGGHGRFRFPLRSRTSIPSPIPGDLTHCFFPCFAARRWSGELRLKPAEILEAGFDFDYPSQPLHHPTIVALEMDRVFNATGKVQAR